MHGGGQKFRKIPSEERGAVYSSGRRGGGTSDHYHRSWKKSQGSWRQKGGGEGEDAGNHLLEIGREERGKKGGKTFAAERKGKAA